jgi:uncharacterized protein YbcV (DUF1398 family)
MNYEIAKECTILSDEEKITFPEVVRRLQMAEIELYYADLLSLDKTYYSKNESYRVVCSIKSKREVATAFNMDGIVDAIRQSQTGKIRYQQFLKEVMDCGVVSYMVFINGRKAIYFGRNGEQHIEKFPGT